MTVKAEVEFRREADAAEISNKYESEPTSARLRSAEWYSGKVNHAAGQSAKALAVPQFSAKQVYVTIGLYGILLSSALWASINVLNWVWHKLL